MQLTTLNSSYGDFAAKLSRNTKHLTSSVGRLSSGERITQASDDIASLSVSTSMLTRTTSLRSTLTNLAQAGSLLDIMDGALSETQEILQRMSQLSVMANSGGTTKQERAFLNIEFQNLKQEIDHIANSTSFNGVSLLNGESNFGVDNSVQRTAIEGSNRSDRIVGSDGADAISSGIGNDVIEAGSGNDIIDAGTGADRIDAGSGDDEIIVGSAGAAANSNIALPVSDNLVVGLDASDTSNIVGHPGNVAQINDGSGQGNDITSLSGSVTSGTDTINGVNALSFNGASILQIADNNNLNLSAQNTRTIMVAFETGNNITNRQVIYEQGGTVNGFNLYIDNGQLYAGTWRSNGGTFNHHLGTAIEANTSYTAGLVFDFGGTNDFTAYLNGSAYASVGLTTGQSGHSGNIGVGGMHQDTRFFDGSSNGNGFEFNGKIGELLNYQDALDITEANEIQSYLGQRWGVSTAAATSGADTILGGEGYDTLRVRGNAYNAQLDGTNNISGLEEIILSGNDNAHGLTVTDGYFQSGEGVLNDQLVISAAGNSSALTVKAEELSGRNTVIAEGGRGDDTFNGSGSGNFGVSYANANNRATIDLLNGTATGNGNDTLNKISRVEGSSFGDKIFGSERSDIINGGAGNDLIQDITAERGQLITRGIVQYMDSSDTSLINNSPGVVNNITDKSGNGNNVLSNAGNVTSGTASINGKNALLFDGSSSLRIGNSADINTTGQAERSIFMTFETSDDINTRQVLFEEGGGTNGYNIYIENGSVFFSAWQGGGGTFNLVLSEEIEANTAYSGGFVFDSTGGTFSAYLNNSKIGELANSTAQANHSGDIVLGGSGGTFIQNNSTGAGDFFNGKIGELLIYNSALNANERADLQNFLINERISGYGGNDVLNGGAGNDTITAGAGNDTIDGGSGDDIAVFTGRISDYTISRASNNALRVIDNRSAPSDGATLVRNIEKLQFANGSLSVNTTADNENQIGFLIGDENSNNQLFVDLPNITTDNLFESDVNISSMENAAIAFNEVQIAMNRVTSLRATIGSKQSSVGVLSDTLSNKLQNQDFARGALADTDIAFSSTEFALQQVQGNLITAMAAQTNNLRSTVILDILEGGINITPTE